ncbi:MAG: tetratricopeptide repeat protein, partial [Planctomycetota bacterium]|nr:tetratricopeptide repeat protein [Planctomycetota bacterium]
MRLKKLAGVYKRLGKTTDSRACSDLLRRFFPNTQDTTLEDLESVDVTFRDKPADEIEAALNSSVNAAEKAAVSPEVIWKNIQALQRQMKNPWPSILELAEQILEAYPDFERLGEVQLARAQALAGMKRDIEAWIVYAQVMEGKESGKKKEIGNSVNLKPEASTPQRKAPSSQFPIPFSLFSARAELAELLAQSELLPLAVAHAEILEKDFPEQRLELTELFGFLGERAVQTGSHAAAIRTYRKILDIDFPCEIWLSAPRNLASAYEKSGDRKTAMEWYEKFLAEYPTRMNRYLEEGEFKQGPEEHRGYFKNRERFAAQDTAGELEKDLFRLSAELGDRKRAADIRRGLLIDLLGLPAARDLWLEEARRAAREGNTDEAMAAYLRSVKPARTVLPQMKAKHAVNQQYLDALRLPQPEEELAEIFAYLEFGKERESADEEEARPQTPTPPSTQPPTLLTTWKLYWQQERDGLRREARQTLEQFIDTPTPPNSHTSKHLHLHFLHTLALSYQQEGLHYRAIPIFEQILDSLE